MTEQEALSPGQALGRYELLAQVARGGMGEVWAARLKGARGFQKLVAIKTLLPELRSDIRIEEMLLEEARIASLIHHPNVVQTTELGEAGKYLYLVMEWVDGESLSFLMKRAEERGWVPIPIGVNLVAQACRGLHAAHELTSDLGVHLGVVHRDVSPHNVLVTHSGVVKLVDFGIAKATNEQGNLTANGELKGKYSFMAPEQALSNDVDRRADVFALGITLYMLVTGRHPFKTGAKQSVLGAITSQEPATSPRKFGSACSVALEAVVLKALEKDPDKRFQSTEAMRVALENAVPEAFAPRFEAQVREYLTKTMGDRALARREALRRFQLSADERMLANIDTGAQLQVPSQSAGSLRAIVVEGSQPGVADVPVVQAPRASDVPTELGQRRRGRRLATTLVATAGLAALAAVLVMWGGGTSSPTDRAGAAPAPAATLESHVRVPEPRAEAVPQPSVAASVASAAPAASVAPRSSATQPATGAARAPGAKKRANKADAADLIAPDFAK
jgi:tRNA A-37 threonylcarbamoyl transferase component Bud32